MKLSKYAGLLNKCRAQLTAANEHIAALETERDELRGALKPLVGNVKLPIIYHESTTMELKVSMVAVDKAKAALLKGKEMK